MYTVMLWLGVAVAWCMTAVGAGPLRTTEVERQACGDKLANIMSLVCSSSGYNDLFGSTTSSSTTSSRAGRVRRGIVDECCRNSCSPAMLRLYCRPVPEVVETTNSIRKRRDSSTPEEKAEKVNLEEIETDSSENQTLKPHIVGSTRFLDLLKPTKRLEEPQHVAEMVLTRLKGPLVVVRTGVLLTRLLVS